MTRFLQGWKLYNMRDICVLFLTIRNMLICYYMSAFELNVSEALSGVANTVSVINPVLGDPGVKENTDATTFRPLLKAKCTTDNILWSGTPKLQISMCEFPKSIVRLTIANK